MCHTLLIKPVYRCRRVQIYLWDLKCLHLAVIESNVCRSSPHIAEIHISSRARARVCVRIQSFWRPEISVWKNSAVVPRPAFYRLPTAHQKSADGRLACHRIIIIIISRRASLLLSLYIWSAATSPVSAVCPGFWSICGGHPTHRHTEAALL